MADVLTVTHALVRYCQVLVSTGARIAEEVAGGRHGAEAATVTARAHLGVSLSVIAVGAILVEPAATAHVGR